MSNITPSTTNIIIDATDTVETVYEDLPPAGMDVTISSPVGLPGPPGPQGPPGNTGDGSGNVYYETADGAVEPGAPVVFYDETGTVVVEGQWSTGNTSDLLQSAQWRVDAGSLTNASDGLRDLSGGGNDLEFTSGSEPVVLPHDGEDYVHIPNVAGNSVSIALTVGTAWTATKTDDTTVTGTTTADPWVFSTAGDWARIESDNGNVILDPSRANADQTLITNTGTAGGDWTVSRAATGLKTVVVDRPKLLTDASNPTQLTVPGYLPGGMELTAVVAVGIYNNTDVVTNAYNHVLGTNVYRYEGWSLLYNHHSSAGYRRVSLRAFDDINNYSTAIRASLPNGYTLRTLAGRWDSAAALSVRSNLGDFGPPGDVIGTGVTLPVTDHYKSGLRFFDSYGNAEGEVHAAAIFDRALTDTEIAEVSAELQAGHPLPVYKDDAGNASIGGTFTAGGNLIHSPSGITHTENAGTPEGVVTAVVGSTCINTLGDLALGGAGDTHYVKTTGSGSTGWVPGPECYTGWRDISSDLLNGWVAVGTAVARIRRRGDLVTLRMGYRVDSASATSDQFLDLMSAEWAPSPEVNYYTVGNLYSGQAPTVTTTPHSVWTNTGQTSGYGGFGLECKIRDIRTTCEVSWVTHPSEWVPTLLGTAV